MPDSAGPNSLKKTRIVVLGGGFGGGYTARWLERLCDSSVEIVLVSRDNFFLVTPLLFEACTGTLELRHCSLPLRSSVSRIKLVEAMVRDIDLDKKMVAAVSSHGEQYNLSYDHVVIALGSQTNRKMIKGSEHAFTFKTLADAIVLRNYIIECLERADVETDEQIKRKFLTFVVIGGGLIGVELLGELTHFVHHICGLYPNISKDMLRFFLLQGGERIVPEMAPALAEHAAKTLRNRGVDIRVKTKVEMIEPGKVHLGEEVLEADTIVLAAGVLPGPVVEGIPLEKDNHGRLKVDATMRCPTHPEVWALGDCASIPDPDGKPYPTLAQHAIREAKVLAHNIHGVIAENQPPKPFVYNTLGVMAALGGTDGIGQILKFHVTGFFGWWIWRTYYLFQMPKWSRRLRIMIDWTLALMFTPDISKIDLSREAAMIANENQMQRPETGNGAAPAAPRPAEAI